ncbi:MAG: hypothetical protein MUQ25_02310, partial [Candidatus Aminicenantes bacterium]|nr:hypothetical protein [Candidatus Aminicenantes bacterium]
QFIDAWADNNGTGDDIIESNESNNRKLVHFTVVGHGPLDHFEFSSISSPQHEDIPFSITITAKDDLGNTVTSYTGTNALTATAGVLNRYDVAIVPSSTGAFVGGVWTGDVTFNALSDQVQIQTTGGGSSGQSSYFNVQPSIPRNNPKIIANLSTSFEALNPRSIARSILVDFMKPIAIRRQYAFIGLTN